MGDIAHIGLVDTHSEGDRGDQAQILLFQKGVLVGIANTAIHARMIGQRTHALAVEPRGRVFHLGAREAIDDTA
ncbi:hypothetical protein D3C87_1660060 [compost metagenome]